MNYLLLTLFVNVGTDTWTELRKSLVSIIVLGYLSSDFRINLIYKILRIFMFIML